MTWMVVVGSSLVMVLWIVIYSYFPSSDFDEEVKVLFGEITFWATVFVSVAIALGSVHSSDKI
jgi:phospholipid-translocating ATPase